MSLKPAIGHDWLKKWHKDVYPHDYVIVNGKKVKPPKYYDRKWSKENPLEFEEIEYEREIKARSHSADNTAERLLVKEEVCQARLSQLKRS
jgi:hypothetical protein